MKEVIENILQTLPIGYYLGYKFDTDLTDSEQSVIEDKTIYLSYYQVENYVKLCSSLDTESVVRTALYSELSTVLLTPEGMLTRCSEHLSVFERERVESLLRNYYMNTNFKELAFCQANKQPCTVEDAWFILVRLRNGPEYFLKGVHKIIEKYSNIKYDDLPNYKSRYEYQREVDELYTLFKKYYNNKYQPKQEYSQSGAGQIKSKTLPLTNDEASEIEEKWKNLINQPLTL